MGAAQVIASYEALLALTGRMRDAATGGEWDAMIELGKERDALLESIKALDAAATLDAAALGRKDELISAILGHDAVIRGEVEGWMSRFEAERRNSRQELRLLREYGA